MNEEEFKIKIDELFNEYRDSSWKQTQSSEMANLRMQLSASLFGNDSVFSVLDEITAKTGSVEK